MLGNFCPDFSNSWKNSEYPTQLASKVWKPKAPAEVTGPTQNSPPVGRVPSPGAKDIYPIVFASGIKRRIQKWGLFSKGIEQVLKHCRL